MSDVVRVNPQAVSQRTGNDGVYGTGADGNVVISSNTALARDMYYENLTINNGFVLNPNGFRIFVKNTLTINGTLGISKTVSVTTGTVSGTTPKATSTSNSIGGSAAGSIYTASQLSSKIFQDFEKVIFAKFYLPSSANPILVTGGAGGEDGVAGTRTLATAGSGATSGGAGGAGGGGGAGSLNRNPLAPGGPGTAGTAGTPGTPGTNGAAGSTPPAAAAGVGAAGGGIVVVIAKTIAGSGSIISQGSDGTAGGPAATGTGATSGSAGAAGAAGAAGTAAPGQALAHYNDGNAHYRTGDGTHGPHAATPAPNVPHGGHVPYTDTHYHGYTYRYVYQHHNWQDYLQHYWYGAPSHFWHSPYPVSPFAHHYNDYHTPINHGNFNSINGVYHGSPSGHNHHRPHGGVATWHYGTHYSGNFNNTHDAPHFHTLHHDPESGQAYGPHNVDYWYRHHHDNNHGQWILRNAGSVSHVGHLHAAGGAAGTAGTAGAAGAAGTPGTNGSTAAGTFGKSGGGGGILILTEQAVPVTLTLSAAGGLANSASANSGLIITVLNQ